MQPNGRYKEGIMEFKVNIPDSLVPEIKEVVKKAEFASLKEMFIAYLRHEIKGYRGSKAVEGIREAAEATVETLDIR